MNMMRGDGMQVKVALRVRMKAKPGKEADVEHFHPENMTSLRL
jgi:hypothetical protein